MSSRTICVGALCLSSVVGACGAGAGSAADGGRDSASGDRRASGNDGGGDRASDGGGDAGPPSVTCTDGTIVANEMNDYLFSSSLTLPVVQVKPLSNLTFNWGGVTQDFLGHAISPTTDLDAILLLVFDLPLARFEMEVRDDSLSLASLAVSPPSLTPTGGATSAPLYGSFSSGGVAVSAANFGQYLDASLYPPTRATFIIAAQKGASLGVDLRMLQAFELDPTATNTTVNLTNSSTIIEYSADLHHLHPTGVPAGTAAMTLDWGKMKTNALGATFYSTYITSAIVGHYDQTPDQLEAKFGELRTIATHLYSADIVSGVTLDFTRLADSTGNPFPGIDATGTWMVALICGNCRNPAPWYLTLLEPVPQPCAK